MLAIGKLRMLFRNYQRLKSKRRNILNLWDLISNPVNSWVPTEEPSRQASYTRQSTAHVPVNKSGIYQIFFVVLFFVFFLFCSFCFVLFFFFVFFLFCSSYIVFFNHYSFVNFVKVKLLNHVQLFATPWIVACQAPPSMEFSRQEYWSGLPFPSPGDLPNPGIKSRSPALQADSLPSEPTGMSLLL